MTSPTQLSLKRLRDDGYLAAVVEKFNPFIKIRQDLFGFIDIIAVHPIKREVLGIQATSDSNLADRVKKCNENKNLETWKNSGCKCEVWGWGKKGKAGKRKIWTLRSIKL